MATVVIPPNAAAVQGSTESQGDFMLPSFDVDIEPPWTPGSSGPTTPGFYELTGITEWSLQPGVPGSTQFDWYLDFHTNWHFVSYAFVDENGVLHKAEVDCNGKGSLGYYARDPALVNVVGDHLLGDVANGEVTNMRPFPMIINPAWQPNSGGTTTTGFASLSGITSWNIRPFPGAADTYLLTFISFKRNWTYQFIDMAGNQIPTKQAGPQYYARYTSKAPALIRVLCTPAPPPN